MAHQGAVQAQGQQFAPRDLQRDHQAGCPFGHRKSARHRHRSGQRAAGAPYPRPYRRLSALAVPVAQGQARPVRRPCAERRDPSGRRPRKRDPRVRARGILVDRGAARDRGRRNVHRALLWRRQRQGRAEERGAGDARGERRHRKAVHRRRDQARQEKTHPGAPVHHLDPPAGGEPQAEHDAAPHHEHRAGAV